MISIRPSVKDDADIISDFQIAMALETENLTLDKDVVGKGVIAVYNDPVKGGYYVATENDKVVGSLMITPEWSDWRNCYVMWIQSVYIVPEYRRKGVFNMMYNYVKNRVAADNVAGLRLYVDLSNSSARKVYEKIGMNGDHYQLFEQMFD